MVTILLPVYNDERFLKFTIESLLQQSYKDFVCFIGFNGTVDSSKEIASELVSNDPRFRNFDFGNEKGKSLTLNKLLKETETEFVCLIDGDDIWHPFKLEKQMELHKNYDVIGTLCHYIDEVNSITNTLRLSESDSQIKSGFIQGHNQIVNSSSFFKTEDARLVSGWDSSVDGLEDFDFWLKLFNQGKTFYNIQEPLVYHRVHVNSNFNARSFPYTVSDILKKNQIHVNTSF